MHPNTTLIGTKVNSIYDDGDVRKVGTILAVVLTEPDGTPDVVSVRWDGPFTYEDCEGHESLDGAHMGQSVTCNGKCQKRTTREYMDEIAPARTRA